MRETKFSLGLPLVIAMSVILATSASVGSVLAAGNVTPSGAAGNMTKGNMTAAGGAAGNMTKGNMTAAGGAAGNMTKSASNATSSNSSFVGKIISGINKIFGGKK